jgi:hypothetical protein
MTLRGDKRHAIRIVHRISGGLQRPASSAISFETYQAAA